MPMVKEPGALAEPVGTDLSAALDPALTTELRTPRKDRQA